VSGHGGTRLARGGGLDGGRPKGGGGRRWTGRRGCWVLRGPLGFGWLTGGGSKVASRGGSVTASTAAQWRQKGGGGRRYSTGGVPFIGGRGGWKRAAWRREQWAGNGGSEAMGEGKAAAAAVRRRSARSGRRPGSEADAQGPCGFVFF
jgi:hypothetical protein